MSKLISYLPQIDPQPYGLNLDENLINNCEQVTIPETTVALSDTDSNELRQTIDPLRPSDHNGVDVYLEVLQFVHVRLPQP